ncbi:hypothetical protein O5478_17555 [Escherichia coli]|nr:hypothetical protein [Escherichia coli]
MSATAKTNRYPDLPFHTANGTLDWKPLALEDWSFYVSGHYTGQKRADSATAKHRAVAAIWNTGAAWQVTKDVKPLRRRAEPWRQGSQS